MRLVAMGAMRAESPPSTMSFAASARLWNCSMSLGSAWA